MTETTSAAHNPTGEVSVERLSFRRRAQFAAGLCVLLVAVGYTGSVVARAHKVYKAVLAGRHVWTVQAHVSHPDLGYVPAPNVVGAMKFHWGAEVPVRHDADGMRVPAVTAPRRGATGPRIMAVGDSWTYGYVSAAEDAYVERVAAALDGSAINAAVCGYGLAECVLRARVAIPRYRPDLVLVQNSPWLIPRSLSPVKRSAAGLNTPPYFAMDSSGSIMIAPPVFNTVSLDLPLHEFILARGQARGFAAFLRRIGWRQVTLDDWHLLQYRARQRWGNLPDLPTDHVAVLRHALHELETLCARYDAQMVVLNMWWPPDGKPESVGAELGLKQARVVNVTGALLADLHEPRAQAYERKYAFWRGNPSRRVDGHPNPNAHAAMAAVIVDALRSYADTSRTPPPERAR